MSALLPRKSFFERMPSSYRPTGPVELLPAWRRFSDSLGFAAAMGADSLILHCELTGAEERAELAVRNGVPVWWWAGPDSWKPQTWRATRARCLSLIARGLGLGYVPDAETAPEWSGRTVEVDDFAAALDADTRAGLSVIFTSHPHWPYWRRIAHRARLVAACPQLYGIVNPGTPAELLERGEPWRREFGGGYVPALAMWARSEAEQRAYLEGMRSVPAAIFWHGIPAARGAVLDLVRAWTPGGAAPGPFSPPQAPQGPPAASGC